MPRYSLPDESEFMTVEQCAEVLHMTPAGFRRWCWEGKVPCTKVGRRYLIRTVDFQQWLDDREAKPAPKPVVLAGGRVHPGGLVRDDPDSGKAEAKASARRYGVSEVRMIG